LTRANRSVNALIDSVRGAMLASSALSGLHQTWRSGESA